MKVKIQEEVKRSFEIEMPEFSMGAGIYFEVLDSENVLVVSDRSIYISNIESWHSLGNVEITSEQFYDHLEKQLAKFCAYLPTKYELSFPSLKANLSIMNQLKNLELNGEE